MLIFRPRRNRKSPAVRNLVQENRLNVKNLIYSVFVTEDVKVPLANANMPGILVHTIDSLVKEAEEAYSLGLPALAIFPVIPKERKDDAGSYACSESGLIPRLVQKLKQEIPELCLICDVALDPYTSHGHDGLINSKGEVDNDQTVKKLAEMSVIFAEAGVDMVAPSDMMDGRVGYIRHQLDQNRFFDVNILSYTAKYASAFYGPYRDTLSSHVAFGSKKGYQMNPANQREAILEAMLDEAEGADILMVKPALPYLDVISKIKERTPLPIAAFQVSGEYSMIMAAAERGWLKPEDAFCESLMSMKRAGADMIISYASKQIAHLL